MGNKKNLESWGEEVSLNGLKKDGQPIDEKKSFSPVVFHFRPTKYLVVAPDRLKEWENYFAENVGLRPDKDLTQQRWSGDPKETISGSNDDWDDCDYW